MGRERNPARWRREPSRNPLSRYVRAARWTIARFVRKRRLRRLIEQNVRHPGPEPVEPVWPLPRSSDGPTEEEIRARFTAPNLWYYDFQFDGGLNFPARRLTRAPYLTPDQPLIRFRHLMPRLLQSTGGTLAGKRVLDIACNSGFWAVQCALLGAKEVVGFDARPEQIEQAEFLCSVVGVKNARFQVLDYWDMAPETLGGTFDVILNLGTLIHLPDTLEALRHMIRMAHKYVLIDTKLCADADSLVRLKWEEPADTHFTASAGMVAWPSRSAVELMFRHLRLAYEAIPIRMTDVDAALHLYSRGSWLVDVEARPAD